MAYQTPLSTKPEKTYRRGRFTVSEGVAPAEKILPFPGLKTLWVDEAHKPFFESVILRGTIVSAFYYDQAAGTKTVLKALYGMADADLTLDGTTGEIPKGYYAVPCIGLAGFNPLNFTVAADGTITASGASDNGAGDSNLFVPVDALKGQLGSPIGALTMDAYRPFDRGENEGISFITKGYVEWPIIDGTFDNSNLVVGDYVKPDPLGRPVKWNFGEPDTLRIGRVVAREDLGANTGDLAGASDYDFGFLNYMTLPVGDSLQEAILKLAYGTPFGVRGNVNDLMEDNATLVGVVRVSLFNM